jgi:hypothetical protein
MGVTRETLVHYKKLAERGDLAFTEPLKIMELGAQTVHFDDKPFFRSHLSSLGLDIGLAEQYSYDMSCKFMHRSWGHDYTSIDLDPLDPESLQWDLNYISCPEEHLGKYDLVTNHGTTEHLIGQATSFKLMHDLMKVGGISIHVLPCLEANHGFYSYSPVFFECLARDNGYETVGLYISECMSAQGLKKLNVYDGAVRMYPCYVHAIFKKLNDDVFKTPSQIHINGVK